MALLIADVLRQVRTNCGCPTAPQDPSGLSDVQITDCTNIALQNLSRQLPTKSMNYVLSVANQQVYNLPTAAGLNLIAPCPAVAPSYIFVLYLEASAILSADAFVYGGTLASYSTPNFDPYHFDMGVSWYANPSLYETFIHQMKSMRRIVNVDFTYDYASGNLTIIPPPGVPGQRYWYLQGVNLSLDTIPDLYQPALLKLIEADVLKAMAMVQQRLAATSEVGHIAMFSNVKYLLQESKDRLQEALTMITEIMHVQGLTLR